MAKTEVYPKGNSTEPSLYRVQFSCRRIAGIALFFYMPGNSNPTGKPRHRKIYCNIVDKKSQFIDRLILTFKVSKPRRGFSKYRTMLMAH